MGWIWQQADWPGFHWQDAVLQPRLRSLHRLLGQLLGECVGTGSRTRYSGCQPDGLISN